MKFLVIGCGPAGVVCSMVLRKLNPKASVTVVGREPAFVRCSAPYILSGNVRMNSCIEPATVLTSKKIKVVAGEAVGIGKSSVRLSSGKELAYDRLVIATGARPFVPPIKGSRLNGVFVIRSPSDVSSLKNKLRKSRNVAIIGGGMIGAETASLLSKRYKVTLIEMLPGVLSASYGREISSCISRELEKSGVGMMLGKPVKSINGSGSVESVTVGNKTVKADLVILAAGIRPETALAEKAGIKTGKFGILTDRRMETSMRNVFAAGDCTQTFSMITRKPLMGGLATTAVLQGRIAAMNASGRKALFGGVLNSSVTEICGVSLGSTGMTESRAKDSGIRYIAGKSSTMTKYSMQPGAKPLFTKLIFDRKQRVIGGQVMGYGGIVPGLIDLISFAINKRSTREELLMADYSAHPELTSLPFTNPLVMACEDAKA